MQSDYNKTKSDYNKLLSDYKETKTTTKGNFKVTTR